MKETTSAGGIVLNTKGEIALVLNGPDGPWWGFPKGHVDPGESRIDGARREIEEETGLTDLTFVKELGNYARFAGGPDGSEDRSEWKTIHMFLFTTEETALSPQDPQNPEARWFAIKDVLKALSHPVDRAYFNQVKSAIIPS